MKRRYAFIDGSVRRALAIVFACLFVFEAAGLSCGVAAMASTLSPAGAIAETNHAMGDVADVASQRCDRFSHDGAPAGGRYDHIGFCAFCSAGARDAALFNAPPPSPLIAILTPADAPPGRLERGVDRDFPLPSSSGLDESRFATAPPRA
jgi:hypothetical protein